MRSIAVLYGRFAGAHEGTPPANEKEFREFIASQDASLLQSLGVASVDELFVSPRDSMKYEIVYGVSPGVPGTASPVVAYEQYGYKGRRYVGYSSGMFEEVDEQKFQTLIKK